MSTVDLALRYAVISAACQLACAWVHTFHAPWPLVDTFELAPTVEEQLFKSLGVRFGCSCPVRWLTIWHSDGVESVHADGRAGFARPACVSGTVMME